jgi:uncharacterized damage-inducible protein DinB
MYRSLADFRSHFQEEVVDTVKVLRAIPDASAAQSIGPKFRDLRRLGWHLVQSLASLLKQLEAWTDADLLTEDTLWGMLVRKKGYSLQALEMHQAHHRGQMTVLMRQAGLCVPEFYGPTLEVEEAMAAGAK